MEPDFAEYFPNEIYLRILDSGDAGTLLTLLQVKKDFRDIEQQNPNEFWKLAFKIFFPEYKAIKDVDNWRKLTLWMTWAHARVLKFMGRYKFSIGFVASRHSSLRVKNDTRHVYYNDKMWYLPDFVKDILGIESGCLLQNSVLDGGLSVIGQWAYSPLDVMFHDRISYREDLETFEPFVGPIVYDYDEGYEKYVSLNGGLDFIYWVKTILNPNDSFLGSDRAIERIYQKHPDINREDFHSWTNIIKTEYENHWKSIPDEPRLRNQGPIYLGCHMCGEKQQKFKCSACKTSISFCSKKCGKKHILNFH